MAQHAFITVRNVVGLLCTGISFLIVVLLATFDFRDPSFFNDVASLTVVSQNTVGGWWGATVVEGLFRSFGLATYLFVPLLFLAALFCWRFVWADLTRLFGALMLVFVMIFILGSINDLSVSGYLGYKMYQFAVAYADPFLLSILVAIASIVGLMCVIRFSWACYLSSVLAIASRWTGLTMLGCAIAHAAKGLISVFAKWLNRLKRYIFVHHMPLVPAEPGRDSSEIFGESPFIPSSILEASAPADVFDDSYKLPLNVLYPVRDGDEETKNNPHDIARDAEFRVAARALEAKLRQFGIEGTVVSITAGPTVALFSYAPATDVKVSRIVALEDDLALALEARSLRVIAPMPGTAFVGFEVANCSSQPVLFADFVLRKAFRDPDIVLPLMLGKNSTGDDRVIDLSKQPHLLIAGSTGSGKSVALQSMISGLISSRSPDELRLVLVDPKRLEFACYADLAHLFVPIITDGQETCRVLRFLTEVMEKRYQQMAEAGVRNVQEFHRLRSTTDMPYIVVVIDELADLMMVAGKDLDVPLIRLAQMARAAGIHLIVATQRPSVDVLTGLVKVNFPARIAFKVASKTDARTILDQSGAERLLGRGDMLFLDARGGLDRIQGTYVSDDEIRAIVDCVKRQCTTDYVSIPGEQVIGVKVEDVDPLLSQVVEFVRTVDEISISLIQRRFRIGYNRSARLVDQLECRGIILPAQGGKMRRVAHDTSST